MREQIRSSEFGMVISGSALASFLPGVRGGSLGVAGFGLCGPNVGDNPEF